MRKFIAIFAALYTLFLFATCVPVVDAEEQIKSDMEFMGTVLEPSSPDDFMVTVSVNHKEISEKDIELIALLTMAEAESECEEGKRLIIDTILNRMDSEHYPDTVHDVIYQPYQFSPMWNGRIKRCTVQEDVCQLVREELISRLNCDVIFFTSGGYSAYGVPMFQVGNHYFSSYN